MLPLCHPSRGSARPTPAPMSIPAAFAAAARRKRHQTYPELARARRCRLVEVVGVQVRGRFGAEPVQLLRLLARQKAAITAWGRTPVRAPRRRCPARLCRLFAGAAARKGSLRRTRG